MALAMWAGFGNQWNLDHLVDFDGAAKRIRIAPGVGQLDVKTNLYSAWKEWMQLYDNSKYLPAFRTIGGDPLGGDQYAGDLYFLMNGWQIEVNHPVQITGVLYHDDGISPYVISGGGGVTATVAALVQNTGFSGTINNIVQPNILPKDVWDYLLAEADTPGSVGERLSKLLTVAKFLGLK